MISSYFHHVSIIFPSSYFHHHISIIDTSYFHHISIIDIINFFLHPQDLSRRFPTLSGHDQGSHGTLGDGSVPSVRPLLAIFGLRLVEASEVRKSWGNPWEYRNIHYKWRLYTPIYTIVRQDCCKHSKHPGVNWLKNEVKLEIYTPCRYHLPKHNDLF